MPMHQPLDILAIAYKQPVMHNELVLLHEKDQQIPGSVQYVMKRYNKHSLWNLDEAGMMIYHFRKDDQKENYLELRFCVAGNTYCRQNETDCEVCKLHASRNCMEKVETVDVLSFKFST